MSISAMKQALEALENTYAYLPRRWGGEREADQAITALRQAIAEAEKQEPDKTEQGRIKSAIFGNNIEVMMDSDLSFLKALETTLKTYDHTTPVHASDISQECADETAKYRHEFECPRCGHCCQQREWVEQPDLATVGEVGVWGEEKNT
jgi:hypothetical protein